MGKVNYHDASVLGIFSITLKKGQAATPERAFLKIILILGLFQL